MSGLTIKEYIQICNKRVMSEKNFKYPNLNVSLSFRLWESLDFFNATKDTDKKFYLFDLICEESQKQQMMMKQFLDYLTFEQNNMVVLTSLMKGILFLVLQNIGDENEKEHFLKRKIIVTQSIIENKKNFQVNFVINRDLQNQKLELKKINLPKIYLEKLLFKINKYEDNEQMSQYDDLLNLVSDEFLNMLKYLYYLRSQKWLTLNNGDKCFGIFNTQIFKNDYLSTNDIQYLSSDQFIHQFLLIEDFDYTYFFNDHTNHFYKHKYIGQLDQNFKPSKYGKLYYKNQIVYEGEFSDGMKEGYGTQYKDGEIIYQGLFSKNNYHGQGIQYIFLEKSDLKDEYSGFFNLNEKHGRFEVKMQNGSTQIKYFKNDREYQPQQEVPNVEVIEGYFKSETTDTSLVSLGPRKYSLIDPMIKNTHKKWSWEEIHARILSSIRKFFKIDFLPVSFAAEILESYPDSKIDLSEISISNSKSKSRQYIPSTQRSYDISIVKDKYFVFIPLVQTKSHYFLIVIHIVQNEQGMQEIQIHIFDAKAKKKYEYQNYEKKLAEFILTDLQEYNKNNITQDILEMRTQQQFSLYVKKVGQQGDMYDCANFTAFRYYCLNKLKQQNSINIDKLQEQSQFFNGQQVYLNYIDFFRTNCPLIPEMIKKLVDNQQKQNLKKNKNRFI